MEIKSERKYYRHQIWAKKYKCLNVTWPRYIQVVPNRACDTCCVWFATFWWVDISVTHCCWFTSVSHACFWVDWWFFLTLTQQMTTVWSSLLLWCRVPPITKSTRKRWPLERWERDPVYPEQNPYSWLQPSPAPGLSDMPSTHTLVPSPSIHTQTCSTHTRRANTYNKQCMPPNTCKNYYYWIMIKYTHIGC